MNLIMKVIIFSVLYTGLIACTFYNNTLQCDNNNRNPTFVTYDTVQKDQL